MSASSAAAIFMMSGRGGGIDDGALKVILFAFFGIPLIIGVGFMAWNFWGPASHRGQEGVYYTCSKSDRRKNQGRCMPHWEHVYASPEHGESTCN